MNQSRVINSFKGRKLLSALFALALAPLAVAPKEAKAEPAVTAQHIAAYQAADENKRLHILMKLVEAGYVNAAEQMMRSFPMQGPFAINRTLYVEGLIAKKRGQMSVAAAKFRAALANDPHLTMVRVELTKTLAAMDENDSAKHHLKLLEAETSDPQQLAGIRSFIQSLDARHPITFSGFVSIAPSTNINQGSSHSQVYSPGIVGVNGVSGLGTIAPTSQKTSGIGTTAGFSLGYTKRLNDSWQAVMAASLSGAYYPLVNSVSVSASQSAELRYKIENGYLGIGGVASQTADPINLSLGYVSYGPRVSVAKMLTPRDQLTASAIYEWRNYNNSPAANGTAFTANAVLTHALDSTSNIALLLGYENVTQTLAYNSYQDVSFGFGVYKELPYGITAQTQATIRLAGFNDVNPVQLNIRQDQNFTSSVNLTKRDWNLMGFAPSLNYTYVRNISNNALFDFDSHSVDLRMTKNF